MNITRTRFTQADGLINKGPKGGSQRWYRDALFSTLVHLQPKLCLEIGTHYGGSSAVFQEYFNKFCPDGRLVTCDIHKYTDLGMPNVQQVLVYPHSSLDDITKWHSVDTSNMLSDFDNWHHSVQKNIDILKPYGPFDFCFLDGDHTKFSASRDIRIAEAVLKDPKWILFDDTDEFEHECAPFYLELKSRDIYDTYEFEDWDVAIGAALIRRK